MYYIRIHILQYFDKLSLKAASYQTADSTTQSPFAHQ